MGKRRSMMSAARKNVSTIAAGKPFARILAMSLLAEAEAAGRSEDLGRTIILLPTRRACHVLREAFLNVQQGRALLLPRMQPIGDLDEEELSLSIAGQDAGAQMLSLPPAIAPMRREILLARLIQARAEQQGVPQNPEQNLGLARALAQLVDQVHTENLDLSALGALVPDMFAAHWQITLNFLEIISLHWPEILKAEGAIDPADRRNRLILALADLWEKSPPPQRIIAAGSTGSIPATARLLSVIAGMERGCVILPGLDRGLDDESWGALGETHPQYGFKHLLAYIGLERHQVTDWAAAVYIEPKAQQKEEPRRILAREIMRPAATVENWIALAGDENAQEEMRGALRGLSLLTCENERKEAESIAILLRQSVEQPDKTACLITPDRNLALRVASACRRWGIEIDDSAGKSLDKTPQGVFFLLVMQAVQSGFSPSALLAFLKHPFCRFAGGEAELTALDLALRGPVPAAGFAGLVRHVAMQQYLEADKKDLALRMLERLENVFAPFLDICAKGCVSMPEYLRGHIALCEALALDLDLWEDAAGQNMAVFLSGILEHGTAMEALAPQDYSAVLLHFMKQVKVRPAFGMHPRVQILGQLEARLVDADLVILGGLNEGTWPPDPGADPWMSRPMRAGFGLPSLERSTGLAAHDFVQGFCAPQVVMTRARRIDGVPCVPARWLQRLGAVLNAAGLGGVDILEDKAISAWVAALDQTQAVLPALRPAPCPPPEKRPPGLSVTQVETWMKDPYSIYARHILKLKKMDALEQPVDAAIRGSLLHEILEVFVQKYPRELPQDAARILYDIAVAALARRGEDPAIWSFWWPRFARVCDWLIAHEADWRHRAFVALTEDRGAVQLSLGSGKDFTLSARVDRIDRLAAGGAVIVDYKSGGTYSGKALRNGALPQLPLEALIAERGGFEKMGPVNVQALQYWVLNGSDAGGKIIALDTDVAAVLEDTYAGLLRLIAAYDAPGACYPSLPRPGNAPAYNDYEHLARVREWSAAGADADAEDAA
ncbi:MAG: double-strand break repair protein AddB [Alphaproteobacteria bacterium]|nr:double-strand break repair protein AddB [Alphaproteobacteria bacterium]